MSRLWLQEVNNNYSGSGDQQLEEDVFTFFCTNGRTKRLWKQLAERIGNTQRASKETKGGAKKLSQDPTLCTLFRTLGCGNKGIWHKAAMPTSGSTWFNGAVEPLTQTTNCDCGSCHRLRGEMIASCCLKHENMTCKVLPASKMRILCGLYHWTFFGAMSATHSDLPKCNAEEGRGERRRHSTRHKLPTLLTLYVGGK